MAKKNKSLFKNPYFRIIGILFSICFVISVGILSFNIVYEEMFSGNPRFRLRNVIVKSSGYWNNRADDVMRILDIKKGASNIFNLNLSELRRELEEKRGDGIAFAEVSKELPDTLKVEIVERIPQAVLYNKKSGMLVDKDGVIMNSKFFKDVIDSLPVITGFKISENNKAKANYFGQTLLSVKPALMFISIVNENFSDLEIRVANLYFSNRIIAFVLGPENKVIKVVLPFPYSNDPPTSNTELVESSMVIKAKLSELRELLKYLNWKKNPFTEINMLYKNQAIVR